MSIGDGWNVKGTSKGAREGGGGEDGCPLVTKDRDKKPSLGTSHGARVCQDQRLPAAPDPHPSERMGLASAATKAEGALEVNTASLPAAARSVVVVLLLPRWLSPHAAGS